MKKIDDYIANYPPDIQQRLELLRLSIKKIIPDAKKVVVMYAAHKEHIGFYPMPQTIEAFKDKLTDYSYAEGTVRFPHNKDLPLDLIKEMVTYRLKSLNHEH
jgi:uncharacterized protein YdhG (YjbR/CyaY superfamily)